MFVVRRIRSIFKVLNSALSPNQVAFGFCFGVMAGFPPMGLHSLLIFLAAFFFNTSFTATLLAFAISKLFAWLLMPMSYEIGKFVLEHVAFLEPVWTTIFNWPVLALMEYNNYVVFGSYIVAFVISVPVFFLVRSSVRKYRDSFFEFLENRKSYQKLKSKERTHKIVQWIVMGGGASFEDANRGNMVFQIIRKSALVIIPVTVFVALFLSALIATFAIDRVVIAGSSFFVGGEVDAEHVSMNALSGRINVSGFSVQDPKSPEQNMIQVGDFVANISYLDLLSARFVFDEIGISEVGFHLRREEDGSLNIDDLDEGLDLAPYFDWLKENADRVDWVQLIAKYIESRYEAEEKRLEESVEYEFLKHAKVIDSLLPFLAVKKISVEKIQITLVDEYKPAGNLPQITMVDLILENVELPAHLATEPMEVGVRAYLNNQTDSFIELSGRFDEHSDPPVHTYRAKAEKIDMASLGSLIDSSVPFRFEAGLGFASFDLTLEGEQVLSSNELAFENLVIAGPGEGQSVLGLPAETTSSVVDGINAFAAECGIQLGFLVDGPRDQLQLQWDEELLKIAKRGMLIAGGRRFADDILKIDDQLGDIGSKLGEIGSQIDPIGDILGGLLPGSGGNASDLCEFEDGDGT